MDIEEPPGANCLMRGDGGNVKDLPVVKDAYGFTSAWRPTREELKQLLAGAPIFLTIIGQAHPAVCLHVGDPADAPTKASVNRQPLP